MFELTGAGVLVAEVLAELSLGIVVLPAEDAPEHLDVATKRKYGSVFALCELILERIQIHKAILLDELYPGLGG